MIQNIKTILTLAVAGMILSSCITKPYTTPVEELDNLPSYNNVEQADTATLASLRWDEYYNDPYLQCYIAEAADSNFNVRIAIKQIEQAQAYFKQSKAAIAPAFSAGASATYYNPSDVGVVAYDKDYRAEVYNFSLSASWEVDIWGKLRSAKRAAYANLLSQHAAKDAVVTQMISQIAGAYYQLLALDYKLKVINETVINNQAYLETVSALKESGQTSEVAVQQALAQLMGAKMYIPQLEASIVIMENYICYLMGRPGTTVERTELNSLSVDGINSSLASGVPSQLLQYRPDVRQAEFSLRAAHESFNMSKAAMYPSLTLSGQVGSEAADITNWFAMPTSLFWTVVGGLTQPIFAGRQLKTAKEVASLQKDQALLGFQSTLLNAAQEVSNAYLSCNSSAAALEMQQQQVDALRKALDYSEDLMVRGYATYLDVLAAQSALFASELSICDSYLSAMSQKIDLYRALGGGWNN